MVLFVGHTVNLSECCTFPAYEVYAYTFLCSTLRMLGACFFFSSFTWQLLYHRCCRFYREEVGHCNLVGIIMVLKRSRQGCHHERTFFMGMR